MEIYSPNRRPDLSRLIAESKSQAELTSNTGDPEFSRVRVLPALFAEQVASVPDAIAVVAGNDQLTYRELDQRANQLAHYLRKRGVGPEVIVGIFLERSIDMVVALMGILKAGGAYLPLDLSYPVDRLDLMLQDARATVLLTQRRLLDRLPAGNAIVTCLDREKEEIRLESTAAPDNIVTAANLAYVIYTSGSTGRPKGVMVTHGGLVNYLQWCSSAYDVAEGGGSLVHSPIGFDLTVTSLFAPLVCGNRVTLVREDTGVEALSEALSRQGGYSLLKITPAHVESLGYTLSAQAAAAGARALIIGGEALRGEHLAFWRRAAPDARIFNEYGPTETVVGCCVYEVPAGEVEPGALPIGWPIANTQLHILDQMMQTVPFGEPGELYIGGAGVARGYLNAPELTAEKFVPHPFTEQHGERLYRSGDKARYLPDGSIEFLGRIDDQVKVRGYRIEPAEVEAVLLQHPAIREGVVMARKGLAGDMSLTAYLVWQPNLDPTVSQLRDFLSSKLPEYMIPAGFVVLDELPLTANGKVDRGALPSPEAIRPQSIESYVAARDRFEEQLALIWETVLGIKGIGVRDNFFELGGNSLLAVRLFVQIAESFGCKLPSSTLFRAPTIELLALLLRDGKSESETSLVAIQPQGTKPPLYCFHACGAHVFIYLPLVRHLDADQPVYGLQARGISGRDEPFTQVSEMAAHYVQEIRLFQPQGPYYLLGDTLGGLFAFEVARLLGAQGEEVGLLAMIDTHCPLRLSLWRRLSCERVYLKEKGLRRYVSEGLRAAGQHLDLKLWKIIRNRDQGVGKLLTPKIRAASKAAKQILVRTSGLWFSPREEVGVESPALPNDPLARTEHAIAMAVQEEYSPRGKVFPGRITYFLAQESPYQLRYKDNRLDWKKLAGAGLEIHVIPAGHDTIREEPHVAILARKLKVCLERARQSTQQTTLTLFLAWVLTGTMAALALGAV